MLKDITLGQYFPGDSFLHHLDPRIKIISAILYIVVIFLCKNLFSFAFITLFTLILVFASGISVKTILKGIKPLVFILIFTTVYNVFFYDGETLLVDIGFIDIYYEGVMYALVMAVRIICLLVGSSVILTYTTSPIMLTDGLERLLSPLSKIKLPVHEFAMMMTIALRFIPTLIEETDKIMSCTESKRIGFFIRKSDSKSKSAGSDPDTALYFIPSARPTILPLLWNAAVIAAEAEEQK